MTLTELSLLWLSVWCFEQADEPSADSIASRIVERMEHASAFLEKTVTRAVVSVPSGASTGLSIFSVSSDRTKLIIYLVYRFFPTVCNRLVLPNLR